MRAVHRGVYVVGPVAGACAREMAAMLACGESAAVGLHSAAALWQFMPADGKAEAVDIMIRRQLRRQRPGVRVHRVDLHADDVTTLHAIRLTTPARTLYDLAVTVAERELERALANALARKLTTRSDLAAVLRRLAQRPGTRRLQLMLGGGRPAPTRSEAEEAFLALLRKTPLRLPEVNARVQGYEVDFFWRRERFVVEIDGFASHSSHRMFESDRRRDAALASAGIRVMRVTWRQIMDEPEAVLVRLSQALARAGEPGGAR